MRFNFYKVFTILFVVVVSSCGAPKQIQNLSLEAKQANDSKEYAKALEAYDQVIEYYSGKNKVADGAIYEGAGIAAYETGDVKKSIEYLEQAKQTPTHGEKTISTLALAYKQIDNLSKELNNLELFVSKYSESHNINNVNAQLFDAYFRSENWDLALNIWSKLSTENQEDLKNLTQFMKVNCKLEKDKECGELAEKILKSDKSNVDALEVLAEKYFWLAEKSYQKEMKDYEQNRTAKQYKKLLKELEIINANYRTSRDYFLMLYKLNPDPKFANYLGNIFTRFEVKEKADYYYRKAKENN
ncbi:MAG TPA: hypothetical protein PL017_07820 [Tenuifilaceae bacterium]|nr:hypothetical protein [Tenuifilaceae bacterium]HPE18791.1 hypothetical protein [Tenuifilaceae bacterium]HPJ45990.1 hypothetical protein [Tenuifilaceae bacterium]HPQ34370.1 hypothetical protein [Tenuifilaceae bacterium]HRX68312.1 hypothetical protein [Tenuifilaceae bacterium]